jgi:hypothetical protein
MDISLSELLDITFGDENTSACQSFIKRFNANAQKVEDAANVTAANAEDSLEPEIVHRRIDGIEGEQRFISRPIEQAFGGNQEADNFQIVNKQSDAQETAPEAQSAPKNDSSARSFSDLFSN